MHSTFTDSRLYIHTVYMYFLKCFPSKQITQFNIITRKPSNSCNITIYKLQILPLIAKEQIPLIFKDDERIHHSNATFVFFL